MSAAADDWLEVLEALLAGDRVALARISSVITGFLSRLGAYDLRDSWDDICQEVLISLIRSARRGRITNSRSFVSYVGTITRNELYDWLHKHRRKRPASGAEAEPASATETWLGETRMALQQALGKLPEREQRAVEQVYLLGRTYDEAAGALNTPLGTLKRLLRQGLATLRRELVIRFRGVPRPYC